MGDSEDEYDRKRRDKFRGERSEYRGGDSATSTTIRRQPPSSGHDWNDRGGNDWGGRGGYRGRSGSSNDYHHRGGGRIVPPHEYSPPGNKRPRTDWNTGGGGERFSHHDNFSISSGYSSSHTNKDRDHESSGGGSTGPQLLSFKNWLSTQDDTISDQEALSKYAEYKQEFKKQKLNEFFMNHRNEEWFKNKFHPDDSVKRKEEQLQNLKKRVGIFLEFLNSSKFDEVTLDSNNSDKIVKLMDWFVIRMEDGTDDDAAQLLSTTPIAMSGSSSTSILMPEDRIKNSNKTATIIEGKKRKSTAEDGEEDDEADADPKDDDEDKSLKKKKNDNGDDQDEEDDENKDADKLEGEGEGELEDDENGAKAKGKGKKRTLSNSSNLSENAEEVKKIKTVDEESGEDSEMKDNGEHDEEKPDKKEEDESDDKIQITVNSGNEKKEKEAPVVPLLEPLHRTASIFIRNLAPTITKQEVESLCKKYPGFLRVALADPQPERKWMRRGWVTFKRNVNIKEICWNLNNLRLRDTELQPIVNKDLTRRVRTVNGITPHKMIVRNDIRLAAKLIQHLDTKMNLWIDEKSEESKKNGNSEYSYGVYSANPVLKNITDYLIEEASAEEEELLGISGDQDENDEANDKNFIERDEELIRVLDRLLYYLRFVHSVDYYNHSEYPYEDEMPNRLGISHGRGLPPASKVNLTELQEYNRSFEAKILTFIQPEVYLNDEECKNLGQKDVEVEVEKFITSNTQELGKDKWLCPLSGKKFKGPEFVRKHILNKHGEKLEEVQKEVAFFNFYLRDPKRPEAASIGGSTTTSSNSGHQSSGDHHSRPHGPYDRYPPGPPGPGRDPARSPSYNPYDYPYGGPGGHMPYGGGYYPPPMMMGGMPPARYGGYPPRDFPPPYGGNRGRSVPFRSGGRDHRAMISYRDLDAPPEPDDY